MRVAFIHFKEPIDEESMLKAIKIMPGEQIELSVDAEAEVVACSAQHEERIIEAVVNLGNKYLGTRYRKMRRDRVERLFREDYVITI